MMRIYNMILAGILLLWCSVLSAKIQSRINERCEKKTFFMCSVLTNKRAHLAPALSTQHNIFSSHFYVDKTAVQLFSTFPSYLNEHFPWVCFMQGSEVLALCGCSSTNAKQLRRVHQTGWGAGTENIATTAIPAPATTHRVTRQHKTAQGSPQCCSHQWQGWASP